MTIIQNLIRSPKVLMTCCRNYCPLFKCRDEAEAILDVRLWEKPGKFFFNNCVDDCSFFSPNTRVVLNFYSVSRLKFTSMTSDSDSNAIPSNRKNGSISNGASSNGHDKKPNYQSRAESGVLRFRESIITNLLENNKDLQFVASFTSSVLWYCFLVTAIFNTKQLKEDFHFFYWSVVENLQLFFVMWFQLFGLYLFNFLSSKLLLRKSISKKSFYIMTLLAILASGFVLHYEPWSWKRQISGSLAFGLYVEHIRILMKTIAFAVDTVNRQEDYERSKVNPTFRHFLYYFFAPILVYRDVYPRCQGVNWKRVIENSVHFIGTIYLLLIGLRRFIIPHFSQVCRDSLGPDHLPNSLVISFMYGVPIMVTGLGYGIFHCWLNIFAEILRFGDRHFYDDWWNVTNSVDYLRKWNIPVGSWIFEHLHVPLVNLTGSRPISKIIIYFVSAICHDYILYGIIGFWMPLHMIVYPSLAITSDIILHVNEKLRISSYFTRLYLMTGFQFMNYMPFTFWVTLAASEYYARRNRPDILNNSWQESIGVSPVFIKCISFSS